MVICRGAACIFFWEIYMLSFFAMSKRFARILGYLQTSLFCVFLFNSLFYIPEICILYYGGGVDKNEKYGIMNAGSEAMYRKTRAGYIEPMPKKQTLT